jgi:hypothetical protein
MKAGLPKPYTSTYSRIIGSKVVIMSVKDNGTTRFMVTMPDADPLSVTVMGLDKLTRTEEYAKLCDAVRRTET